MNTHIRWNRAWSGLAIFIASFGAATSFASPTMPEISVRGSAEDLISPAEAVRLAMQNRPVVAAAQLEIAALEMKARAARTTDPLRLWIGRGSDAAPGATDNDLALVQPIDWFGRNRLAGTVVEAEMQVAHANLRQIKLDVQSEVLRHFNEVVALERRVEIARDLLEIATRFRDAAKRRVDAGQVPEVQLLRATIECERATQVLALRESELVSSRTRLFGVVGVPGKSTSGIFAQRTPREPDFGLRVPRSLVLDAELKVIEARIQQERHSMRPDVEVQLRRSPWMEDAQFGFRVQVSMPLTDYGRSRRNSEALLKNRAAIEQRKADTLRLAESEFRALLQERMGAERLLGQLKDLVEEANELLQISEQGFEAGALTLLESLEAARSLREIEEALLDARFRLATLDVNLLEAEGVLLEEGA